MHAGRWAVPYEFNPSITLGQAVAATFDFKIKRVWVWIGIAVNCAWIVGLNVLTIFALKFFPRECPFNWLCCSLTPAVPPFELVSFSQVKQDFRVFPKCRPKRGLHLCLGGSLFGAFAGSLSRKCGAPMHTILLTILLSIL